MQNLIYHVAVTLDGFIARTDGTAPGFTYDGEHVDAYREQLATYAAVVMGRATYEAGYAFGMKPGQTPYGDKPHHIFSRTLSVPTSANLNIERGETLATIDRIKSDAAGPVYLSGGGRLAGFLLEHDRIDTLRLKLAPLVYGRGIKLFEDTDKMTAFRLEDVTRFPSGDLLLDYSLR